jgi:nitroreductase
MDMRQAAAGRYSCRAFLPDPVAETVVRDIPDAAPRAPSGGTLQPWRFYALAGLRLETARPVASVRRRAAAGGGDRIPHHPPQLKEPSRTRRFAVGELLYRSLGIAREDRPARIPHYARNFDLFGAPVGPLGWAAQLRPGGLGAPARDRGGSLSIYRLS